MSSCHANTHLQHKRNLATTALDWVFTSALTLVLLLQRARLANEGMAPEMMASSLLGLEGVLEDPDLVFETVQSALAVGHPAEEVQERHVASAPP